jgi:hypothetical protein
VTNNRCYVTSISIQTHKWFCCHGLSQHALQSIRYIAAVPWCFLRKCYKECPTTYQTRQFFNIVTNNEDIAQLDAHYRHIPLHFSPTNVLVFKSRCNTFIGFGIIKEMPGLEGSGTPCIMQVSVNSWLDLVIYKFRCVSAKSPCLKLLWNSIFTFPEITGFSNAVHRIVSFLTTEIQYLFGQELLRGLDDWVKTVPVINLKKSTRIIKLCRDISGSNNKIHQDMNDRNYKSYWPL